MIEVATEQIIFSGNTQAFTVWIYIFLKNKMWKSLV